MFSPIITTARLRLIPLTSGEPVLLAKQLGWLLDKTIMQYSEQRHRKHTRKSVHDYIRSFDQQRDHILGIFTKGEGPPEDYFIGTVSVRRDKNNGVAEIGILLGEQQNKGYGLEAWQAVSEWVLSNGTRKIEAGCMDINYAMNRICQKSGMTLEGRRFKHFLVDGMFHDMLLYGQVK